MPADGCSRVYVGRLSYRASDRDLEYFFRGYGKIHDIVVKNGFAFVDFVDSRDADDAVHDLNGKDLRGERVRLEFAKGTPHGTDKYREDMRAPPRRDSEKTDYRLVVENLSSRCSWQDLKDFMRQAGEVTYTDAHSNRRGEGLVEFASKKDMYTAMDTLDGKEINGKPITLVEEKKAKKRSPLSRSRSRSRSPRRSRTPKRKASRSRSRSPKRSSRSARRSRSRTPKRRRHSSSSSPDARRKDRKRDRKSSPSPKPKAKATSESPERKINSDGEEIDGDAEKEAKDAGKVEVAKEAGDEAPAVSQPEDAADKSVDAEGDKEDVAKEDDAPKAEELNGAEVPKDDAPDALDKSTDENAHAAL